MKKDVEEFAQKVLRNLATQYVHLSKVKGMDGPMTGIKANGMGTVLAYTDIEITKIEEEVAKYIREAEDRERIPGLEES